MNLTPPTPSEFHDLVVAALRFRDAAPWKSVGDDQVFGILDRASDEIVYVSILGNGGLEFGVTLFPGGEGLKTLDWMQFDLLPADTHELLLQIRSIACVFVPSTRMTPQDRRLLREAGFTRGRAGLMPQFVSYLPGFASWTVSGAEARLLVTCMAQSLAMVRELAEDPDLLERGHPGEYLVRVPVGPPGEPEWVSRWLPRPITRDLRPPALDEVTLARLSQLPRAPLEEWEVDAITGLGLIAESPSARPRVLRSLMILDRKSLFIHTAEPIEAPALEATVTARFARQALRLGRSPKRILVRDYTIRRLLAPVAQAMDCKLLKVGRLPGIAAAREDMLARVKSGARL
jgi:hypothetical protein